MSAVICSGFIPTIYCVACDQKQMFFIKLRNDDAFKLSGIWKHERLQKQCQRLKAEYIQNY